MPTSPRSVNLMAFDNRFATICRTRKGSPRTSRGAEDSAWNRKSIRFCAALAMYDFMQSSATVRKIEGNLFENHVARFDLGEIENIVQKGQEGIGATLRDLQLLALLPTDSAIENQVEHAQQAVHGRPQLVGDMFARNSLLAWLAASAPCMVFSSSCGALADAFLEEFLVLPDFLLRSRESRRSCG